MFGVELPGPRRRTLALDEGATVMRRLLSGQRVSFEGEIFRLSNAQIRPASPVPIIIGGSGERHTLRVVARHADEWNIPGVSAETYRRKAAVLEAFCEQERRDPARIGRSIVFAHAIAATDAEVRRITDEMLARTPPRFRPGSQPDAPAWLVGTPRRVVEQLHALTGQGIGRVMLQYRQPPTRAQLELVATEIMPYV
jgi:alkanesulfonate monooxygenase SsuD/methylene tetrahydromethanopterin reductase-like flavin-dependent oxidoreductase (luciferase family)